MSDDSLIIYEEEIERIDSLLTKLLKGAEAKCALLVGERSILAVIFDDRTTIGMVRLYAKESADELAKIFVGMSTRDKQDRPEVSADFAASAGDKLDDIFKD